MSSNLFTETVFKNIRLGSMASLQKCRAVLCLVVALSFSLFTVPMAHATTSLSGTAVRATTDSYNEGHVYLYNGSGCTDVTSTVTTDALGNTFATMNGQKMQIVCSYNEGHVYSVGGSLIGFIFHAK